MGRVRASRGTGVPHTNAQAGADGQYDRGAVAASRLSTRSTERPIVSPERRRELRAWTERLNQGPEAARAAARAIVFLLDELERVEAGAEPTRLAAGREQLDRLHDRLAGGPEGARAAARAIRLLRAELERLDRSNGGELEAGGAAPERDREPRAPAREAEPVRRPAARAQAAAAAIRGIRLPSVRPVDLPRPSRRLVLVVAAAGVLLAAVVLGARALGPDLDAKGPSSPLIGAAASERLSFSVSGDPDVVRDARWSVDGEDASRWVRVRGDNSSVSGLPLEDGEHTVSVEVDGPIPGTGASRSWTVEVDRTPPKLAVDGKSARGTPGRPAKLTGTAGDAVHVAALGKEARVEEGRFRLAVPLTPTQPFDLVAVDRFGNRAVAKVKMTLIPREPRAPVRSVHMTFYSWANDDLRAAVLRMVDEGRINSVELDLKDESGIVGWDADVPLARKIGAVDVVYDLPKAIELLHSKGVHVIGRIVAFRDPIHAPAAWKRGWRAQVIQTPTGQPYAGYGGFTNFANPAVRQYNIDIARRAAEAGIDDILYDYVRRPDGPPSSMTFPGLRTTPEKAIASFLADARRHLAPYDTFLGASVFGVAASRPTEIAQDIPAMARNVDYIAPMVYPSHWGPGEYEVANPNAQPYDIVRRSLEDFQRAVRGTGARVVPWLQDFSYGVTYGPAEVRAQIKAGKDIGIDEWILWDAEVTYTAAALDPHERQPPIKTVRHDPKPPLEAVPGTLPTPAAAPRASPAAAAARKARANELGLVPVLMYHQIRADGGGPYDLTPAEFRAELERLRREGYHPIRAVDLATGQIDVPAGKSPVVLTFDDSTKEQLSWDAKRRAKPGTAIAILEEFARDYPEFEPTGTFYVNRDPFAGVPEGPEMLRWLHEQGWELGNHTRDHLPFTGMAPREVQRQLVLGRELIVDAVPDAEVRTMALPLGVMPEPAILARRGSWRGRSYRHAGVFLVGAEPSPSPFSASFARAAIPRIRTTPPGADDPHMGSTYWLHRLRTSPGLRYVSDGDPETISFPRARARDLAPALRTHANPY